MPTVKIKGKKIKLPYNKAGKKMAAKLKKKKKIIRNGVDDTDYNPSGGLA